MALVHHSSLQNMIVVSVLFLIFEYLLLAQAQTTYKAKVLDFTPKDEGDIRLTIDYNLARIKEYAEGPADIVVFPEYGIFAVSILHKPNYTDYAIKIPEAGKKDFCKEDNVKHEIINKLSCIAKQNRKYIIVNVLEKDSNKNNIIYNTNVVLDRNGLLIAKYRKINLFGSEKRKLTPGTEIVTFTTDFNVHFGLFTCYDILFRKPAIDILNKGVTDIIFPTAWFSEIPFLTALQVQNGYADKAGVNFLASCYNLPKEGFGGSGIYLANGHKSTVINTVEGIYPVELDVPIISKREENRTYLEAKITKSYETRAIETPINFPTIDDIKNNYKSYKFEILNPLKKSHHSEFCSPDSKICCSFSAKHQNIWNGKDITYMFTAYSKLDRGCALLSCNNTNPRTCGNRLQTDSFVFDEVVIKSTLPEAYVIPSTLNYNMTPIQDYTFSSASSSHEIKGNKLSAITTFGIYSINDDTTIPDSYDSNKVILI